MSYSMFRTKRKPNGEWEETVVLNSYPIAKRTGLPVENPYITAAREGKALYERLSRLTKEEIDQIRAESSRIED